LVGSEESESPLGQEGDLYFVHTAGQ
jgi:hypothetical protein